MVVAQNDILRVAARLEDQNGDDVVNVYHFAYRNAAVLTDAQAMDAVAAYLEEMYTEIQPNIHSSAIFRDINYFNVTTDMPMGTIDWPTLTTGAGTGDQLPNQMAAMVRGVTGHSRNWARKFLGPWGETRNSTYGKIDATLLTALANYAVQWLEGGGTAPVKWFPIVWNKVLQQWVDITGTVIRDVWSTIRRRRAGRGA